MNLELGCCAQSASAEGRRWGKPGGSQSLQRDWGAAEQIRGWGQALGRETARPRVCRRVQGCVEGTRLSLCGRLWTRAPLL